MNIVPSLTFSTPETLLARYAETKARIAAGAIETSSDLDVTSPSAYKQRKEARELADREQREARDTASAWDDALAKWQRSEQQRRQLQEMWQRAKDKARELRLTDVRARSSHQQIEAIKCAVANHFKISRAAIDSPTRKRLAAWPRQVAVYLVRTSLPGIGLKRIGTTFGKRDHTTILYAARKVEEQLTHDQKLAADIASIKLALK